MNNQHPINFVNNQFIFDNGERSYFTGEKEFTTMPNKEKIKINRNNVWKYIKEIFVPISQITANIMGYEYRKITPSDKIGFYDLECDDSENFILGYVNDKKFTDPKEMVKEMFKYDILVNFNGFRFDNQLLKRYAPEYFLEVRNADFISNNINGKLTVDLYSIISVIVGLESYSANFLAQYNGFPEKLMGYENSKEEKCLQDIRILRFLWGKYNIPKVFNKLVELCNIDTTLMQVIKGERLRKWILMNKYIKNGYFPLRTDKARNNRIELGVMKYFKKGLVENYRYDDIASTYPTKAINLGNLGIYDNDATFSELQKELKESAKDKELKPFMKSIGNALCGIQYSLNEYWRNDDIFEKIVTGVADDVKEILNSREDIIYINTDCFVVPNNSPKIEIEGYDVKTDYVFDFLYIYNQNKWIGKTKERIEYRGFSKLNSRNPKVISYARDEILSKLFKSKDKEEFKELLDDPDNLVSKTLKGIRKFPLEDFKISIRKTDEYCKNPEYFSIWKNLKIGFNDLYHKKGGKFTDNPKEIDYSYYKEIIKLFAGEYSTTKE